MPDESLILKVDAEPRPKDVPLPEPIVLRAGMVIGRDAQCDVRLVSSQVSRRHCRIESSPEGWVLVDLGSRNGTLVAGERIHRVVLRPGTRIEVGEFVLSVARGELPPRTRSTSAQALRIPDGRERYGLDLSAYSETEWPERPAGRPLTARFEALYRGSVVAAQSASVADLLEGFLEIVTSLFPLRFAAFHLSDAEGLRVAASVGAPDPRTVVLAKRAQEERASFFVQEPEYAAVVATLKTTSGPLGVLVGMLDTSRRGADIDADDLELFIACGHQASLSLEAMRRRVELESENHHFRARLGHTETLVGSSSAMERLRTMIERVARADGPVLIQGESGTGKELVARAIHRASRWASGPFIAVNCGGLTDTLVRSELFGHERGAFTGADRRRPGVFEEADGGTLFLDEIGELPLEVQTHLLRVLETWEVTRIGASRPTSVRVRLLAATHRNLEAMVEEGRFREDLYYRIQVVMLEVPSLRDRLDDLPALCRHLLERNATRRVDGISASALEKLRAYHWPGNVRELRNVLERALILGSSDTIEADDVRGLRPSVRSSSVPASSADSLKDVEAAHIANVLEQVRWNKSKAAELLGIERPTLYQKIKRYGLEPPR